MTIQVVDNTTQLVVDTSIPLPWKHQPYETYEWYGRFLNCYLMLPRFNRSILQAYKQYRIEKGNIESENVSRITSPALLWSQYSNEYNWRERALAYDAYIDDQLLGDFEENAKQSKAKRIQAFELVLDSVMQFYARGNVKYDASSANATLKTVTRELREEYQPTHRRGDNRTQIINLIGQLPGDLQSSLQAMLKKATD